jgi:hypothetical protein
LKKRVWLCDWKGEMLVRPDMAIWNWHESSARASTFGGTRIAFRNFMYDRELGALHDSCESQERDERWPVSVVVLTISHAILRWSLAAVGTTRLTALE